MQTLAATPKNGELGFWMAGLADEKPAYPRFSGQLSVDLAIIGGGYTGLWAAYFAKKLEPSLSVAVFEAEQVGYGASGRNGGWLSAMIPGNRATFARASGGAMDASRALQQEFITGVDSVLEMLKAEGINADQHKGGALVAAHTKAGLGRLGSRRDTDLKYGLTEDEVQFLDRNEFQDRINISTVHGGLFYKHCARLQPAKLVYGLADRLTAMGVHIYERSRVDKAEAGTLVLAHGRVTAGKTFICTEGYSGQLLGRRTLIPINSSMIVTKPLSAEAWRQIGWNGLQCLSDSAHTFIYAQRTSDGRIAIGGRGRPYRYASGTGGSGTTAQSTINLISEKLATFFPGIHFDVDHAWSGVLGVTRDWNGGVHWNPATGTGVFHRLCGARRHSRLRRWQDPRRAGFRTGHGADHASLGGLPRPEMGAGAYPLAGCPRHVPAVRTRRPVGRTYGLRQDLAPGQVWKPVGRASRIVRKQRIPRRHAVPGKKGRL